jgi:large subunit ribosomal protein L29
MSIKEFREKSAEDLRKELLGLRREQFNLRMARATGQAAKPDQFTKVRRNIARLKTVLGEQARGVTVASAAAGEPQAVSERRAAPAKKAAPKKAAAKTKVASKAKAKSKSA